MMTGHTKGPWRWVERSGGHTTYLMSGDDSVMSIYESHGGGDMPNEASARLIAAAPDLLAALAEARHQLENYELAASGEQYNSLQINAALNLAKRGAAPATTNEEDV